MVPCPVKQHFVKQFLGHTGPFPEGSVGHRGPSFALQSNAGEEKERLASLGRRLEEKSEILDQRQAM